MIIQSEKGECPMISEMTKVNIVEIGPRDGLQNEEKFLETHLKIQLIKDLVDCGFKEIEATSFVHPKWIPNLADAEEVLEQIKTLPATFFALVPNQKGYERAKQSGVDGVTLVMSATDEHNMKNMNRSSKESLEDITRLSYSAKEDGLQYRASISTVFGCPFEGNPGLDTILFLTDQLVESGFKRIGFCDTIGVANPKQVYRWLKKIKSEYPDVDFELHFHDTYGRGLSNVVAGLQAGVTTFDSSIGGLGGCPYAPGATGNISTEDLNDLLLQMGIQTGISMDRLLLVSKSLNGYIQKDLESNLWKVKYKNECKTS